MIRARFHVNPDDYRPIKWPIPYPYWCSGYGDDYSIVVAFADSEEQILEFWPDATEITSEEVAGVTYSSRFPQPSWYGEGLMR